MEPENEVAHTLVYIGLTREHGPIHVQKRRSMKWLNDYHALQEMGDLWPLFATPSLHFVHENECHKILCEWNIDLEISILKKNRQPDSQLM